MTFKKLVISLAIGSAMLQAGGLFSTISGMAAKEVKPKAFYTVDTAGYNPRIYEFSPQTVKGVVCIILYGNNNGEVQMECVKVKEK